MPKRASPRKKPKGLSIRPQQTPLQGRLALPGDKSLSHRALLFGALAEQPVTLSNLSQGADVQATVMALKQLGVTVTCPEESVYQLQRPERWTIPSEPLDCGNSGTTMRLLCGWLAGQGVSATLVGDASLSRRPMKRVINPLRQMGAHIESQDDGDFPPLWINAAPLKAMDYELTVPSAQVKSAILFAALGTPGATRLCDPFGTRDHTERAFKALGLPFTREGAWMTLSGPATLPGFELTVPGDISSAAFIAVAATLIPGSHVMLTNVLLNPARLGWVDALNAMGGDVRVSVTHESLGEPVGTLDVRAAPLNAIHWPAHEAPRTIDEFPILSVAAAHAIGTSVFAGLAELTVKESNRLARLVDQWTALGLRIRADEHTLSITGEGVGLGHWQAAGDHRLAMSGVIAGLSSQKGITIDDVSCIPISFSTFFEALATLGAPLEITE